MHGIHTKKMYRGLHSILAEWIKINRKLGRRWATINDAPWWYNERALLSVFAGAVWQNGGLALEEYSARKRSRKKWSRRRLTAGRVDLWFASGPWEYLAEAKHCYVAITNSANQTEHIKQVFSKAKADVRCCPPDGATRRLAILFGLPYVRKCNGSAMNHRLERLLEWAKEVDYDAAAWIFPELKRLPKSDGGWIHPGIVIWIKEVKR